MKKVAVINDLSGFGKCSLTAALPVISAMGVQACPLPTAILSAQTGFPRYYLDDYTDKMENFRSEWEKMNVSFDGIYTGFTASEEQFHQIFRFLETFKTPNNFLLVDPVLGDDGNTYDMFTKKLLGLMKELVAKADVVTPNLTELCLLAGGNYTEILKTADSHDLLLKILGLARTLCNHGPAHVIVTGIHFTDEHGVKKMGNLYATKNSYDFLSFPYVGGSYSGTGDLFASCLCAGIARGDNIPDIIETAGHFIEMSITDALQEQVDRNEGVNFEKFLYLLIQEHK